MIFPPICNKKYLSGPISGHPTVKSIFAWPRAVQIALLVS